MDNVKLLMAEAKLGIDCETFLMSDVGRYLLGRADAEIETARDALEQVAPEQRDSIRDLQNVIWRARSFRQWLQEAIESGNQAEQILRDNDM